MMSTKQFTAMLTLHIIYLLLGASIFYSIQSPLEIQDRINDKLERIEILNLLYDNYIPSDPDKQEDILKKLSDYCGKPMFNFTSEEDEPPIKWDFYHSFFFSYTVVSTIGYGNLAPTTSLGRLLMILYALVGMPINAILLANMGEYFGNQLIRVYQKYHKSHEDRANKIDMIFHRFGVFGQIVLYLVPGFLFFIFLPACLFVVFEGWDYVASIYYAFVTLTTIGFGDLVAGTVNNGFGIYFTFYQIFLIVWITFGLGYIVMLLGFITSVMRSKHIHKLEHKLVQNIKATQNRMLKGFSKDVGYLRRIINEAYLMKVKPVYCEEDYPRLYKSASCPEFTFDVGPREPIVGRKRANSENIYLSAHDIMRIQSDTDLLGIDKEKTFTAAAIVKPAELLARVVNALGAIEQPHSEEEGRHIFSDDDILRSEDTKGWTIGKEQIYSDSPRSQRSRTVSLALPHKDGDMSNGDLDKSRRGDASLTIEESEEMDNEEPKSMMSKLNPFRKRGEDEESPAEYLKKTMRGRLSLFGSNNDTPKHKFHPDLPGLNEDQNRDSGDDLAASIQAYHNKTKKGRGSLFPSFGKNRKSSNDESESDMQMEIQEYQNRTKKGRGSLFPSFNKDKQKDENEESDLEADIRKYQELTRRGRGSIFPSFNIGKTKEEDEESDDLAADILKYQKMTQRGRASLFPSFDISRKSDEEIIPELTADILNYQNKTKRGRGSLFTGDLENFQQNKGRRKSLFTQDVDVAKLPENEQADMLEQTSVADLIRALAVLQTSPESQRKGSALPPGIMGLLSPELLGAASSSTSAAGLQGIIPAAPLGPPGTRRRGSVHPGMVGLPGSLIDPSPAPLGPLGTRRRGSLHPGLIELQGSGTGTGAIGTKRRGSVRPDFAMPSNLAELAATSGQSGTRRRGSIRPDFSLPMPTKPAADADDPLSGARRRRVSARGTGFTPTLPTVASGTELKPSPVQESESKATTAVRPIDADINEESPNALTRRYSPASNASASSRQARSGPIPRMFARMRKESLEEEPSPNSTPPSEPHSRKSSLTDVKVDDNKTA